MVAADGYRLDDANKSNTEKISNKKRRTKKRRGRRNVARRSKVRNALPSVVARGDFFWKQAAESAKWSS